MKMTSTWLAKWLWYFRQNHDFRVYCHAKRVGDDQTCASLEAEFDLIAELYADWGDIHSRRKVEPKALDTFDGWHTGGGGHLFMHPSAVTRVHKLEGYELKEGHILLEVPLSEKYSDVMARIEYYMQFFYKLNGVDGYGKQLSEIRLDIPEPKYQLYAPNGKISAATIGAMKKAEYVQRVSQYKRDDGKKFSNTDIVYAIKVDPDNPFGWSMTDDDRDAIKRGTFAKTLLGSSELSLVKRAKRDFDAYVRNTIYGRFPDSR